MVLVLPIAPAVVCKPFSVRKVLSFIRKHLCARSITVRVIAAGMTGNVLNGTRSVPQSTHRRHTRSHRSTNKQIQCFHLFSLPPQYVSYVPAIENEHNRHAAARNSGSLKLVLHLSLAFRLYPSGGRAPDSQINNSS